MAAHLDVSLDDVGALIAARSHVLNDASHLGHRRQQRPHLRLAVVHLVAA
jgi:hypothetical protein